MANTISSRNDWVLGKIGKYEINKDKMRQDEVLKMLNKTVRMFKYTGLPDTITPKDLEIYNQVNGFSIWAKVNGELYVFFGNLGGQPNAYYLPTIATVANPYLRFSDTLDIEKNCVVMLNDYFYQGLMPTYNKYADLIVEAEISLKQCIINSRVPALIQADNDNTRASAEKFFDDIVKGEKYGVIASAEFFDGIKSQDFYKEPHIKDLIETIQYIRGSWYNEIGIKSAYNMKREAINEAEASLNDDILRPTIDTMLECRQKAVEKINEMFGTNITVELDSVWLQNRQAEELSMEILEREAEEPTEEQVEEQQEQPEDEKKEDEKGDTNDDNDKN